MASDELEQLLQGLGIDSNALGSGGYVDPSDPPVYTRSTPSRAYGVRTAGPDRPGAAREPGRDLTRKSSDVVLDMYRRAPQEVARLQQQLFYGGFYGDVDPKTLRLGDYDERTAQAWERAVMRAANFYAAGRKVTVDQVIEEAARMGLESGAASSSSERRKVVLSNPEDLRAVADQVGQRALGRKARANEVEKIVRYIHEYERAVGGADAGTVTAPPDASVVADRILRETNPGEANEMSTASAIDTVIGMFTGGQ